MYTKHKLVLLALFLFVGNVSCDKNENATEVETKLAGKSRQLLYAELVTCAVRYDMSCIVSVAEDYLEVKRNELLAEADREVIKATGRADSENSPSKLAKSIEKLLSDLSGLFKNGFMGLFKEGENDEVEETENEEEDPKEGAGSRDVNGDEGGKKKKKKKKAKKKELLKKLHYVIIGAIVATKLCLLLKLVQTALLLKLALLGIGILGVSVAKLIILLKSGKPKTIYYENSHHDHHYEHDDVWGDDEHWDRNLDSQNLAYFNQKPKISQ